MSDQLDALAMIARRLRDEADSIGLHQVHFSVHPDVDGDDHYVQVAFCLKDDSGGPGADPSFDEIAGRLEVEIEEQRQAEEAERAEEDRKKLLSLYEELNDPRRGLGLEDKENE